MTKAATKISRVGLKLIEGFEGFVGHPYWDPYGKVWTIGYGETEGVGPNTPDQTPGYAEEVLRRKLASSYEPAIHALGVSLNQNQYDALCSVVWNLGPGIIGQGSQLGTDLRTRKWSTFASHLLSYDSAGGQVLPGLQTRRQAEANLFMSRKAGGTPLGAPVGEVGPGAGSHALPLPTRQSNPKDHSPKVRHSGKIQSEYGQHFKGHTIAMRDLRNRSPKLTAPAPKPIKYTRR